MKITKVECLVLANEHPIVRLETDEGLVGWGECFRRARALVQPAIEHVFGPTLLGQNPLDTEVLHRRLMGMGQVAGPAGTLAVAVAGVDIALWDLKGKALGQPIWQLLGGRVRARSPRVRQLAAPGPGARGGGGARGAAGGAGVPGLQAAQLGAGADRRSRRPDAGDGARHPRAGRGRTCACWWT